MHPLKTFYENQIQREAVKEFMIQCLNELAVERVMNREDVSSLADAKDVVSLAFIRLREIYGEAPKPIKKLQR